MRSLRHTLLLLFVSSSVLHAQPKFHVTLEPHIPKGFPGLQSYAWARKGEKILFIGGRLDGLHAKQPFASFDPDHNNKELILLDLNTKIVQKASIESLASPLKEQLQSSNMQFYQDGDRLVLTGGYGYSPTKKDHISFPYITIVSVSMLIQAIENRSDLSNCFQQLEDQRLAVAGGNLGKLNKTYYLVGGHRFDGRYNPHGPNHGPGYSQQYTEQIRKFRIDSSSGKLSLMNFEAITDTALFHRRDFNLVNQYDEKGEEILTIYSGVFQKGADLPFTTAVDISEKGYKEIPEFNQKYNQYHSAHLPITDKSSNKQYVLFFGGIGWNYMKMDGSVTKDDNIPFTGAISVVERNGFDLKEYLADGKMPGYFGASASFILNESLQHTSNGGLPLGSINKKPISVGYIVGGIDSRAPNVFWGNPSLESRASPVIWEVFLSRE